MPNTLPANRLTLGQAAQCDPRSDPIAHCRNFVRQTYALCNDGGIIRHRQERHFSISEGGITMCGFVSLAPVKMSGSHRVRFRQLGVSEDDAMNSATIQAQIHSLRAGLRLLGC